MVVSGTEELWNPSMQVESEDSGHHPPPVEKQYDHIHVATILKRTESFSKKLVQWRQLAMERKTKFNSQLKKQMRARNLVRVCQHRSMRI
ncbi:hypothetical protein SLA2020_069250 [Shorea laevis]